MVTVVCDGTPPGSSGIRAGRPASSAAVLLTPATCDDPGARGAGVVAGVPGQPPPSAAASPAPSYEPTPVTAS